MKTLVAVLAVLIAAGASQATAAPIEFLFTPSKAIFLANGTEIVPGAKFDREALAARLDRYTFELGTEEGQSVWYVFARRNAEGAGEGGINIYLDRDDETTIDFLSGGEGVIDTAGATSGSSLADIYRYPTANCSSGLFYSCKSETAPTIDYSIDVEQCPESAESANLERVTRLGCEPNSLLA